MGKPDITLDMHTILTHELTLKGSFRCAQPSRLRFSELLTFFALPVTVPMSTASLSTSWLGAPSIFHRSSRTGAHRLLSFAHPRSLTQPLPQLPLRTGEGGVQGESNGQGRRRQRRHQDHHRRANRERRVLRWTEQTLAE